MLQFKKCTLTRPLFSLPKDVEFPFNQTEKKTKGKRLVGNLKSVFQTENIASNYGTNQR